MKSETVLAATIKAKSIGKIHTQRILENTWFGLFSALEWNKNYRSFVVYADETTGMPVVHSGWEYAADASDAQKDLLEEGKQASMLSRARMLDLLAIVDSVQKLI